MLKYSSFVFLQTKESDFSIDLFFIEIPFLFLKSRKQHPKMFNKTFSSQIMFVLISILDSF